MVSRAGIFWKVRSLRLFGLSVCAHDRTSGPLRKKDRECSVPTGLGEYSEKAAVHPPERALTRTQLYMHPDNGFFLFQGYETILWRLFICELRMKGMYLNLCTLISEARFLITCNVAMQCSWFVQDVILDLHHVRPLNSSTVSVIAS